VGRAPGLVVGVAFNLGYDHQNVREPDLGVHREVLDELWVPTAAMVVDVVSPDDESWLEFDHFAAHGVDEVLIADPRARPVRPRRWPLRAGRAEHAARRLGGRAARGHRLAWVLIGWRAANLSRFVLPP
jgi:hypothetical protein